MTELETNKVQRHVINIVNEGKLQIIKNYKYVNYCIINDLNPKLME